MTISTDTFLSIDEAMKAFRPWISAELLTVQFRWLVAESKRQRVKKPEILRHVLAAWVDHHPEERLTKPHFSILCGRRLGNLSNSGADRPLRLDRIRRSHCVVRTTS